MLMIPAVLAPALAPALGPVVGGWLVTDVSWRWIFYVNLPVGVFGFIFGALFLKESREPSAGRFDAAGFAGAAHGDNGYFDVRVARHCRAPTEPTDA